MGFLKQRGYKTEDIVLDEEFAGTLERRKRHFFIAVSENCPEFSLSKLLPHKKMFQCIKDILEPEIDDSEWKDYSYLAEKEKRDLLSGKGFKRQLLSGEEQNCGTIGRGYSKVRSTEPFLLSKEKSGFSRLFTPKEHARLKGIPENLIKGLSKTIAHEILGQSVLYPIFVSFGLLLGETIKKTKNGLLLKTAV
jgi:DNA (cytosine-5)-methyltransferase 1